MDERLELGNFTDRCATTTAFDIIANQVQVKEKPLLRQQEGRRRRRLTLRCKDEA
jgi:hypothetical protein